ncbi:DUF6415 family natural product biosynthesis protein [Streptomyces spiralis]|uniref:DUF6415 family natural product biosynthesis protein n=1 Tax=Streptomyces spiralis TaxID=66376 RepID=UPI003679EB8D
MADLPSDDVPARAALAGVGEAHRWLGEPEAAGLRGEVERVKRLARCVIALSDHCDALSGLRRCPLCDRPIEDNDAREPYQRSTAGVPRSPAGPGRVHADCTGGARRP